MAQKPIEYNGPDELRDLWHQMVAREGSLPHRSRIRCFNYLNAMAFNENGARRMLAEFCPEEFQEAKNSIEAALYEMGHERDQAFVPLHDATVAAITKQWMRLESEHGLYPPRLISKDENGKKRNDTEKDEIRQMRVDFLTLPESRFLYHALFMSCFSRIDLMLRQRQFIQERNPIPTRTFLPDLADTIFRRMVFSYDASDGSFRGYCVSAMRNSLKFALSPYRETSYVYEEDKDVFGEDEQTDQFLNAERNHHLVCALKTLSPRRQDTVLSIDVDGEAPGDVQKRHGLGKVQTWRERKAGEKLILQYLEEHMHPEDFAELPPVRAGKSR